MNFLAHLHLADPTPESWVGSLMPDLVRGRLPADLPPAVAAAVRQHRLIDVFTDTHPVFVRSKARLMPRHGRYSGILVDVFYDHSLARDWPRWSDTPLDVFIRQVHAGFQQHSPLLPEAMRYPIDRMIEQDWLGSYARIDGVETVLRRMSERLSRRFSREVVLHTAAEDLRTLGADFAADFRAFYPELRRFVADARPG